MILSSQELTQYISVDVETAGPAPCLYSLLSIGACVAADTDQNFYIEMQPVNSNATPEALTVSKLSLERLAAEAPPPLEAMLRFETWLSSVVSPPQKPIFFGFNAPFDWMFVTDYFFRFLGRNPFGHSALDLKSLYMGVYGVPWSETTMRLVRPRLMDDQSLSHHALQDAIDQANLFRTMVS